MGSAQKTAREKIEKARREEALPLNSLFFLFFRARAVFRAEPKLTERLEEARSRWLDIGLIQLCGSMDLASGSEKKKRSQHPAILTSLSVNNGFIIWVKNRLTWLALIIFLRDIADNPERARKRHLVYSGS